MKHISRMLATKTEKHSETDFTKATIMRKRSLLNLFHSISFVILLAAPGGQASVSCCSVCDCKSREVWCERRGLTSIPVDIPSNTKRLYLYNNEISQIPNQSLSHLKDLEILDISSNNLTSTAIHPGVFNSLSSLTDLELSGNKLTRITSNTFSGINNVIRLYIENNQIKTIDNGAIQNLSNLVELKLSNNALSTFPKIVACPKLRRLCMNNNRLVRLEFESLADVNLEQLMLSNNLLNQLPTKIFGQTSNMRELDLSRNRLQRQPPVIQKMESLRVLNFSGNAISSLSDKLLENLRRMKVLDLHGMRLTTLPKTFIPRRVFLNIFDISNNPWNCQCNIDWIPKYMSMMEGAFVNIEDVQCNTPPNWKGREINSGTVRNGLLSCSTSNGGSTINNPPPPVPTRRKPTVDLCDGLACANDAICYVNDTTYLPACRCLPNWKGLLCDKPIIRPTRSTTTSTSSPSDIKQQLVIRPESVTEHTVEIIVPSIKKEMKITVVELSSQGEAVGKSVTKVIRPNKHNFIVKDLDPGKRYSICISSTDVLQTSAWRSRHIEDKLCGEIETLVVATNLPTKKPTDSAVPANDIESIDIEPIDSTNGGETNQGGDNSAIVNTVKEENDFPLLYPVIGAAVGGLIILIILGFLFLRYRSKKKTKQTSNNERNETNSDFKNGHMITHSTEGEVMPMITQQSHYAAQPSNQLINQNGDVYQLHRSHPAYGQSPQRVGTPNKTESLGRSSVSGGSLSGTQQSYIDMQRCCSTNSGTQYAVPLNEDVRSLTPPYGPNGNVIRNGQMPYSTDHGPVLNNRGQELMYRCHNSPSHSPEIYTDTAFRESPGLPVVAAVRSTTTTVNQYHQRPIVTTTISPQSPYHQQGNPMPCYAANPSHGRSQKFAMPYGPNAQLMYSNGGNPHIPPDPYTPVIQSPGLINNRIGPVFQDTLVM